MEFPKILLAAPQHESKMYCWDAWWERVNQLSYPNFDIFISDNSPTEDNAKIIREYAKSSKHKTIIVHQKRRHTSLIKHINESHLACQRYAIRNGYKAMFHLETDVVPPIDVIERLWVHGKSVCSGVYDIFYGKRRKAMVQMIEQYDKTKTGLRIVDYIEHAEADFFTGRLEQVYHAGIGCILIHDHVLKQIKFRCVDGIDFHTDTWFGNDCYLNNIPIFVDTTVQCDHLNSTWLTVKDQLPSVKLKQN